MERLVFSIMLFFMFCHFMACFWIFTAELSKDDYIDPQGNVKKQVAKIIDWIIKGQYNDMAKYELYVTSFYFTITTMTTVGYGDISGTNTTERIICIFLMIVGVLFFSYTAGSVTNIVTSQDEANKKLQEKKIILAKLYSKYGSDMRSDLYF